MWHSGGGGAWIELLCAYQKQNLCPVYAGSYPSFFLATPKRLKLSFNLKADSVKPPGQQPSSLHHQRAERLLEFVGFLIDPVASVITLPSRSAFEDVGVCLEPTESGSWLSRVHFLRSSNLCTVCVCGLCVRPGRLGVGRRIRVRSKRSSNHPARINSFPFTYY